MERLLIRVPLLLVEWLNPVRSGATFLLYHKKGSLAFDSVQYLMQGLTYYITLSIPRFFFFSVKNPL